MPIPLLKFINPDEQNEYCAFEKYLEDDKSVFFHMTDANNMKSIDENGFMSSQKLTATGLNSVSYAKTSMSCFAHLGNEVDADLVIIAVRFDLLEVQKFNEVEEDACTLTVFNCNLQPEIFGYINLPVGLSLQ